MTEPIQLTDDELEIFRNEEHQSHCDVQAELLISGGIYAEDIGCSTPEKYNQAVLAHWRVKMLAEHGDKCWQEMKAVLNWCRRQMEGL